MAVSIALAGCYSPRPTPGAPCGPDDACPSGLVCSLGTCELMLVDASVVPDDGVDAPFDVPPGTPAITGITPAQGIVGTVVTIAGVDFGDTEGRVDLDGTPMPIESWSDTVIVAAIPDVSPRAAQLAVATGSSSSDAVLFTVVLPPAVYLSNDIGNPDTISVMTFDPVTRRLAPLGQPVSKNAAGLSAGGCLQTLTVNERTRRVFSTADDAIAVFDIDPRTGGLTRVVTTSIPSGRSFGVQSNDAGTRVYVASPNQDLVSGFAVSATGTLANLPGSPYAANAAVNTLVFSSDESRLYASSQGGSLTTFAVAPDGSLARVNNLGTNNTVNVRRRPDTGQLFLVGNGLISVFTTPSGVPQPLAGSPFDANILSGVPIFDPTHDRLYVPRDGSGQIFGFDLGDLGAPTELGGSPFNFGPGMADNSCGAVSRDGTLLVVAGETNELVNLYQLEATGAPTTVQGSPFAQNAPSSDVSGLAITF